MKMETVIRSPQRGRVKKLAHKEGVSVARHLLVVDVIFLTDSVVRRTFARLGWCWFFLKMR